MAKTRLGAAGRWGRTQYVVCAVRASPTPSDCRCGCALTLRHSLVCERQQGPSGSQTRSGAFFVSSAE
eukprot:5191387-Prymnesium_polylepis.1